MPIKFRCPHCQQFLGISRSRAGAVTDCPMCGRSIRVPLLDGSVEPLPEPELNLQDHGLASALDKLASLVSGDGAQIAEDDEPRQAAPVRSVIAAAPQPIPLPEPIVLQPAPVAAVAEPSVPSAQRTAEAGHASPLDSLGSLAAAGWTGGALDSSRTESRRLSTGILTLAGSLLAVMAFAAGYVVGRQTVATDETTSNVVAAPPNPAPPTNPAPPPPAGEIARSGRIQYIDGTGESRADAGARILILPEERAGSSKLAADGFRAGAAAQDRQLAIASVRAIGGDFAIAAEDGAFAVSVPQPGLYQLFILSRYQARPENEPVPPSALQFLDQYFDRPAQVVGEAALYATQFRYRGSGTIERDHTFESP